LTNECGTQCISRAHCAKVRSGRTELPEHYLTAILLVIGATVGHAFFMVTALNVMYAWPLPHGLLKYTRKLDMLVILAGPVLFWYVLDLSGSQRLDWTSGTWRSFLAPYTVLCAFLGWIVYPICTFAYWFLRAKARVVSETSLIVDVARELGYRPEGSNKRRRLSRIPGNQCFQVEFAERVFELPQLPLEWDGLRILHLSDLHLCGTPDKHFYRFVMDRCQSLWQPDIVALTGDVVDSGEHHSWIIPLLGRLKWNVAAFAILGNHDSWRDEQIIRLRLRRVGMTVLGNSWQQIEVRGRPLIVIGHEGPWFTPIPDLSNCPPDIFRLCLSHTPDNMAWARKQKIDVVLAGHVHGGQIRFPLLGSVFVPSRYSRYYDCGSFFQKPTLMHVSRGLAGQHPLRFLCRPEVTCIVLRRSEPSKP